MKTRIRQLTEQEKRSLGEQQMITDWLQIFPKGILSIVADTFDLWKLITEYLPANKEAIMARDGKLTIRPDSGDPVDIICGLRDRYSALEANGMKDNILPPQNKGVIELLWDIFGGTVNEQGYKVLDSHIGAIYGDSITPERQIQIYERLAAKGFAATNIILGIGSYSYGMNSRNTFGFAAKGAWFEVEECEQSMNSSSHEDCYKKSYNIYKDPVTDDGTKKSLKGLCMVYEEDSDGSQKWNVKTECTWEEENEGVLQTIYEDGNFYNQATLEEIRERLNRI
jgi:nicotinamide phosphoribosyltransferase